MDSRFILTSEGFDCFVFRNEGCFGEAQHVDYVKTYLRLRFIDTELLVISGFENLRESIDACTKKVSFVVRILEDRRLVVYGVGNEQDFFWLAEHVQQHFQIGRLDTLINDSAEKFKKEFTDVVEHFFKQQQEEQMSDDDEESEELDLPKCPEGEEGQRQLRAYLISERQLRERLGQTSGNILNYI